MRHIVVEQETAAVRMTLKEKESIHRALGKIEGVAFVAEDRIAMPLLDAIEVIDCILNRMDGADNER